MADGKISPPPDAGGKNVDTTEYIRASDGLTIERQRMELPLGTIAKHRHPLHSGRNLFEQLQPFPSQAVFERHETGGIAAWPRQTIDEAGADRIDDLREHDRHGARRLQQRRHVGKGHPQAAQKPRWTASPSCLTR